MKKIFVSLIIIIIIAFNIVPVFAFTVTNNKTQFYDIIEEFDYEIDSRARAYYYNDGYHDCFFYVDLDNESYANAEIPKVYLQKIAYVNSFYGRYNNIAERILLPDSTIGYTMLTYLNSTTDKSVYLGTNNMYIWKDTVPSVKAGEPYYFSLSSLFVYNTNTGVYDELYGTSLKNYNEYYYDIVFNEPIIFIPEGTQIYASYKDDDEPSVPEDLIAGVDYEENQLNMNFLTYVRSATAFFQGLYGIIPYEIYIILVSGMGVIGLIAIIKMII